MGFSAQTLWTLAHVQESPLDKIYVLLMIFIGPLAQSSGKLPRNLKESCFQLAVRMQGNKTQKRHGEGKNTFIQVQWVQPNLWWWCFCLFFFLKLWNFVSSGYPGYRILWTKSWKALHYPFVCVFVYVVYLYNVVKWPIWSTAFLFPVNEWSLIFLVEFRQTTLLILKTGVWIIHNYR